MSSQNAAAGGVASRRAEPTATPSLDELAGKARTQVRSAWRFRWYGVAAAWLSFLIGWAAVVLQPDVYEASARVYVDNSSALRPVLNNRIVPVDVATQLAYVRQALLGRTHLERTARDNGLALKAKTPAQFEAVLNSLRLKIEISSREGPNLYRIAYKNSDREKAIGVVTTLLNSLVTDTIGEQQQGADAASRFLEERIAEYAARLQETEQARANFKKRNADRLPGSQGGYFEQLRIARDTLAQKESALRLAESKRERIRAQLKSESPVMPTEIGPARELPPSSIDARIRNQRTELERLLLMYTDKHPDVINARESLERLEKQRAEQLGALGVLDRDQELSGLGTNPVYQTLRIALNDTDVEIATLEADVAQRRAEVTALQALIDDVPDVEAELSRLNRDYDVVYEQYQNLVRSRETQDLSEKARDADEVDFRVIDPPLADFKPIGPNRLVYTAFVFFASLGCAGGLCWLLAQLSPVFHDGTSLREVCGLPVIGYVSDAAPRRRRMRRRLAIVGVTGAMAALATVFAVAVLVELVGPGMRTVVRLAL
jgi:polysaccharide chain length determinant protein (PEP-CTERM system associated)